MACKVASGLRQAGGAPKERQLRIVVHKAFEHRADDGVVINYRDSPWFFGVR